MILNMTTDDIKSQKYAQARINDIESYTLFAGHGEDSYKKIK